MGKDKKTWTTEKLWSAITSKKSSKKLLDSNVIVSEKGVKSTENDVSVFMKTTSPKVIVKSENLKNEWDISLQKCNCKHKTLMFLCSLILCIILLIMFFLTLKTYNTVNELSDYILM